MKKSLVLLMVLGLFVAACNNNKADKNKNSNNREKDDYGKTDNKNNNDEKTDDGNNEKDNDNNSKMSSGWPRSERDAFTTNCVTNAIAGGTISRPVAQKYCDCMLNKMETLYPDILDVAKLTKEDLESPDMEKMAKDCLLTNN
jgi:hypothetical protein